jgi:hypothetical protein
MKIMVQKMRGDNDLQGMALRASELCWAGAARLCCAALKIANLP